MGVGCLPRLGEIPVELGGGQHGVGGERAHAGDGRGRELGARVRCLGLRPGPTHGGRGGLHASGDFGPRPRVERLRRRRLDLGQDVARTDGVAHLVGDPPHEAGDGRGHGVVLAHARHPLGVDRGAEGSHIHGCRLDPFGPGAEGEHERRDESHGTGDQEQALSGGHGAIREF